MSMSESKYALRKLNFPQCAKDGLPIIEKLICGRSTPSSKQLDLAMEISSEFLFCETDRRGYPIDPPLYDQSMKEMQLILVLSNYFNGSAEDAIKNTVFLSLFGETVASKRAPTLWKLVSLAVSYGYAPLLSAVGTWMQQLGCTSSHSLELCRHLIRDFFVSRQQEEALRKLGIVAPRFTANCMTGMAEHYLNLNVKRGFTPPPSMLLEIITDWIFNDPTLCMAAHQTQAALPSGGIAMAAVTPLAGLIKWCVLAPLVTLPEEYETTRHLYSRLYLALLKSLLEVKPSAGPPTAISAQHLAQVVTSIHTYIAETKKKNEDVELEMNKIKNKSKLGSCATDDVKMEILPNEQIKMDIDMQEQIDEELLKLEQEFDTKLNKVFGPSQTESKFKSNILGNDQILQSKINTDPSMECEDIVTVTEIINFENIDKITNDDKIIHEPKNDDLRNFLAPIDDNLQLINLAKMRNLYHKKYERMIQNINKTLDEKSYQMIKKELSCNTSELKTKQEHDTEDLDLELDAALDRLAQAVQVSAAVKCMYGSTPYLYNQLESLPQNQITQIVIKSLRAQTV